MSPAEPGLLEICVEDAEGVAVCAAAGVDRIELCAALAQGGLTPSGGLIRMAAACGVPVHVMIRPRAGDFVFDDRERAIMLEDIAIARAAGVSGVVMGAATRDGTLDVPLLRLLCAAAEGMAVTLHRVVDTLPDPVAAVDLAAGLGFDRILTSGGAATAPDGRATLGRMVKAASGRTEIAAGGGVTPEAIAPLWQAGLRSFHASCKSAPGEPAGTLDFGERDRVRPDPAALSQLQAALEAASAIGR